jgi:DNA replication protein DnaC
VREPGDDDIFGDGDPFGAADHEALWGRDEHQRDRAAHDDLGWRPPNDLRLPATSARLFDQADPPAPIRCSCGREHVWRWYAGRAHLGVRGRWTPPSVSPCSSCRTHHEQRARESEIVGRQIRAGIPSLHRDYRWSRAVTRLAGESWPAFVRRVASMTPAHIGVSGLSAPAARALRDWRPDQGSMYVHGPVGSGKSLMLAATVTALISGTSSRRDDLMTDDEIASRYPRGMDAARALGRDRRIDPGGVSTAVLYVDEEDLVQRVADSWRGDMLPLLRIGTAPVLVLDDLGTVGQSGGRAGELAARCLARLVRLRYDRGRLPMLISSNVAMDMLSAPAAEGGCGYDRRTVDRLEEMVASRRYALEGLPPELVKQGWSWRRPPQEVTA